MLGHKESGLPNLKINKLPDLEKLSHDKLLEVAHSIGIDTSAFTDKVKGNEVLWTQSKRKALIKEILEKNPKLSELHTQKLQKLNKIYLIWAMASTFINLLICVYNIDWKSDEAKKDELLLEGSFLDISNPQVDQKVYTLFDVDGLKFGPLKMGKNIRLWGKIVKTDNNFYIVDVSDSIQGLENYFFELAKDRKVEKK